MNFQRSSICSIATMIVPWCALLLINVWYTTAAAAALGDPVEPSDSEQASFHKEELQGQGKNFYTVRTSMLQKVQLHEYISNAWIVFAVTWQGMRHPDLSPILGRYAGPYEAACERDAAATRGHPYVGVVRGEDIVVEKFGHMRAVKGRAYVPSLLPSGVKTDELP